MVEKNQNNKGPVGINFTSTPEISFEHTNARPFFEVVKDPITMECQYDPDIDLTWLGLGLPVEVDAYNEHVVMHFPNGDKYEFDARVANPVVVPDGWFQAFKDRWFPKWLKRLFPVRWRCTIEFKCKPGSEVYVTKESKE